MPVSLKLNLVDHHPDEVTMCHKYFFRPNQSCDTICATANMGGFTVLNAISNCFNWESDVIRAAADECNRRQEIAIVQFPNPRLLLVPRMQLDDTELAVKLVCDLLGACAAIKTSRLHFTHFGFTSRIAHKNTLKVILDAFAAVSADSNLCEIHFDLDARLKPILDYMECDETAYSRLKDAETRRILWSH